jgi:hypothetical protein
MSQLVSRILLAILMFPLGAILYTVAFVSFEQMVGGYRNEALNFIAGDLTTWLFVAGYWWLLWRKSVAWTGRRIFLTFAAAAGSALVSAIVGTACIGIINGSGGGGFGAFVGGTLAILLWLTATVFLWRDTPTERTRRVQGKLKSAITCPNCGYNMTGLQECRCPECGSKFTIDELVAVHVGATVEEVQ